MYCLGCNYDLRASAGPGCPECGRGFDAGDPRTWSTGRRAVLPRAVGRWAGRVLLIHLVGLVLWCGYELVRGEDVFLTLFIPYLFSLPLLAGCFALWLLGLVHRPGQWRRRRLPIVLALICVVQLGSYWTRWPLHVAYAFSRPALERVVQDAEQGRLPNGPVWSGVFRIERVEKRGNYWVLWLKREVEEFRRASSGAA